MKDIKLKLIFLAIVLPLAYNACGEFKAITGLDDVTLEPLQVRSSKVVAVISQNQLLNNYQSCLGLNSSEVSADTRNAHKESLMALPEEGEVDKIGAPTLMTVTKVVSEICDDIIDKEKAKASEDRTFFKDFRLDGGSSSDNNAVSVQEKDLLLSASMAQFAKACWGRKITQDEVDIVLNNLTQLDDFAEAHRNSALFSCTAVLSSSQAIRF